MKKEKPTVLFVRLPKDMDDELEQVAKRQYRTKASVVRQAIREFLDKLT